jgi:hypothetical protein
MFIKHIVPFPGYLPPSIGCGRVPGVERKTVPGAGAGYYGVGHSGG